ncbi:hypothetical protein A6V29_07800 [Blastococcus sp. CCUG 61487]|nr:hypothetical protein A6V29_07800 [Blastococcus sp. CCUG 61487]
MRVVDDRNISAGALDAILAVDGLAVIGTIGFFGPAAVLLAIVTGAVIRDRRLAARENAEAEQRSEALE